MCPWGGGEQSHQTWAHLASLGGRPIPAQGPGLSKSWGGLSSDHNPNRHMEVVKNTPTKFGLIWAQWGFGQIVTIVVLQASSADPFICLFGPKFGGKVPLWTFFMDMHVCHGLGPNKNCFGLLIPLCSCVMSFEWLRV